MIPNDEVRNTFPELEKFWPYAEVLNKESPRGKVLVSAGFLEEQLKQILLAFMMECPQAMDLIEGGNAPLGTFSARISVCFVLGLITQDEHDDLHLIRKIRNDFAHDIDTTFETQTVVNRCRELKIKALDNEPTETHDGKIKPLLQFSTAASHLIMNFSARPQFVSKQRRKSEGWNPPIAHPATSRVTR